MFPIRRYDPFRDMMTLRSAVDRLFDSVVPAGEEEWETSTWGVALDVSEDEEQYIVKATLPGVKPEDLDVTYNNGVLSIKGEVRSEEEKKQERYHLRERRFGKFARSISLPSSVNPEQIQASYDAGILTLRLPKVEEARPKRIEIKPGQPSKVIEG